jgi:hypothetical protein
MVGYLGRRHSDGLMQYEPTIGQAVNYELSGLNPEPGE